MSSNIKCYILTVYFSYYRKVVTTIKSAYCADVEEEENIYEHRTIDIVLSVRHTYDDNSVRVALSRLGYPTNLVRLEVLESKEITTLQFCEAMVCHT